MKAWIVKLGLLIIAWGVLPVFAQVSATLDKDQIELGETVIFTISMDDPALAEQVDISSLDKQFVLVRRNVHSLISMAIGEVTTKTNLELVLQARQVGEIIIPSLSVGQAKTKPLKLTVNQGATAPQKQNDKTPPVMIEAVWANIGKPYVQSQLNLVVRIYHVGNLQGAALDEPAPKDTLVKRISEDVHGVKSKNGIDYQTLERHFALFPQKSGPLTVPIIAMQMRTPVPQDQSRRFFGFDVFSRQILTLETAPLTINVLPRPQTASSEYWLPAELVSLQRSGLPEADISVGEAINMQLDLNVVGLIAEQLPEIKLSIDEQQFSLYPDAPTFNSTTDGRAVHGSRKQTFVLIPKLAGALEIPKIQIAWWDKKADVQQQVSLPALDLNVLAVPGASIEAPALAQTTDGAVINRPAVVIDQFQRGEQDNSNYWKWLALASMVAWLLTLLYFVYYKSPAWRSKPVSSGGGAPSIKLSLSAIKRASDAGQAQKIWQAMQQYGQLAWPASAPKSPQAWANKLEDQSIMPILVALEDHLFGRQQSSEWSASTFKQSVLPALKKIKVIRLENNNTRAGSAQLIPAMYPE